MGLLRIDATQPGTHIFVDGKNDYYSLQQLHNAINEANQRLWSPVYNDFYSKFEKKLSKNDQYEYIYYGNIKNEQMIEFLTLLGFKTEFNKIDYQAIDYKEANYKRSGTYTSGFSGEVKDNGDVEVSRNIDSYEYTETVVEIYGVANYTFNMRTMYTFCEKNHSNRLLKLINELFKYYDRYKQTKQGTSKRLKGTTFFMRFFMFNAIFLTLALGIISHICFHAPAAKACLIPVLIVGGIELLFRGLFGLLYIKYNNHSNGFSSYRTPITYTLIPLAGIAVSILSTLLTANGNEVGFLVWIGSIGNYVIFGWHFWAYFIDGDRLDLTCDASQNDKSIKEFKKIGGVQEYENQIKAIKAKLR